MESGSNESHSRKLGKRAAAYDAWFESPLGRAMDDAERAAVMAMADLRAGEDVLDVGCGTGLYTHRFADAGANVTGLDSDLEMLDAARAKGASATFVQGDAACLPFDDASFDLTIEVTLLCFVEEPARVVEEMARVTRPGGRVVLADLNEYSLWALEREIKASRGASTWQGAHFMSTEKLAELLRSAGLEWVRTDAAGYLPPHAPSWLISRAPSIERRNRPLGQIGAALVLARGEQTRMRPSNEASGKT